MLQLKFVTTNKNKFENLSKALQGIARVKWSNIEISESRDFDVVDVCKKKLFIGRIR